MVRYHGILGGTTTFVELAFGSSLPFGFDITHSTNDQKSTAHPNALKTSAIGPEPLDASTDLIAARLAATSTQAIPITKHVWPNKASRFCNRERALS